MSRKKSIKNSLIPYLLVGPAIIGLIVFVVYPILYMANLSFFSWNLVSPKMKYIGIENYLDFFTSKDAIKAVMNTFLFSILEVTGVLSLALIVAVSFNKLSKFETFGQFAIFTPHIISLVSVSLVWMWIYEPDYGVLNYVLGFLGIPPQKWLGSMGTAMISLVIVAIWKGVGYYALVMISGLQSIDRNILEAAKLDNASKLAIFFRITIPMLSPTLFFLLIICTINSFKVFDIIQIMTGGGPVDATNMLVYLIYDNAFRFLKIGYASAAGVVLMIIVGLLTIVYFKGLSKKVHYQ